MRTIIAAIAAVALAGCGTTAAKFETSEGARRPEIDLRPFASATDASTRLSALSTHYLAGADRAREGRQTSNGAIAILNTYTLGVLALGGAPNNALISSLLANLVSRFDGINNAGGEAPWLAAIGRNTCIAGQLAPLQRAENHPDLRNDAEMSAAYDAALIASHESATRTYILYREATAQALLAAEAGRAATDTNAFAPGPVPDKAVLTAELRTAAVGMRACTAGAVPAG